jgi:hypothetical protein
MLKKFIFTLCIVAGVLSAVSCASGKSAAVTSITADQAFAFAPGVPDAVNNYPEESMGGKSALDYLKSEKITAGWNVGNTMEAWRAKIDQDGNMAFIESGEDVGWGNPPLRRRESRRIQHRPYSHNMDGQHRPRARLSY